MGHTTHHLQHPRHHRHVRSTNVTPQRPETTPSPSTPPATPQTPIRHPPHAHQPSPRHQCPRHQRHQHHRRQRQRQQLTHQLTTINHSPTPTSSTLTPIPPSPTTPPPTQSSTPAPTPPSPPTSPPPPQGQGSRGMERHSEHATTRTRRPPYRTPLRNTPPRFPRQDVHSSPLLGRRLRRPPGHPTPTGSHGPAPTSPPATHRTAGARPPHATMLHIPRVHRRPERGTPARGARPRPRRHAPAAPPPPKDIYATLASTLAPMDAEQYYQSIQRDLPGDHRTLQGWKKEKKNDNEWGTEEDLLWEDT